MLSAAKDLRSCVMWLPGLWYNNCSCRLFRHFHPIYLVVYLKTGALLLNNGNYCHQNSLNVIKFKAALYAKILKQPFFK